MSHDQNFIIIDKSLSNDINAYIGEEYKSPSDVIRAALQLLNERCQRIENLQNALVEGEKSGFVEDYNPKEHLSRLKSESFNNNKSV